MFIKCLNGKFQLREYLIMKKALVLLFLVSTVYPAASHASVKSDLYAYYTRLDYKIPLSEIRTDVPFARREQDAIDPDVEGRRRRRGSEITGKYADIVVHIDENRRLVFGRETS